MHVHASLNFNANPGILSAVLRSKEDLEGAAMQTYRSAFSVSDSTDAVISNHLSSRGERKAPTLRYLDFYLSLLPMDHQMAKATLIGKSVWTSGPHFEADKPLEQEIHPITSIGEGVVQNNVIGSAPQRQQFTKLRIIAFAFVICNSWAGVAGSIQLALLQGGPATLIYGILISSLAYFSIAASLSELASVYPTAGGQYHFASILAPHRTKQAISYACGLLSIFSWVAIGAAVTIIPAQQIMALLSLWNPGFVVKEWHIFLIYQAIALLVLLYNIFALKWTSWTHYIGCEFNSCHSALVYLLSYQQSL